MAFKHGLTIAHAFAKMIRVTINSWFKSQRQCGSTTSAEKTTQGQVIYLPQCRKATGNLQPNDGLGTGYRETDWDVRLLGADDEKSNSS